MLLVIAAYIIYVLILCVGAAWLSRDLDKTKLGNKIQWIWGAIFLWPMVYPYYFYKTRRINATVIFLLALFLFLLVLIGCFEIDDLLYNYLKEHLGVSY